MSVVQWIFLLVLSTSCLKVYSQDVDFTNAVNCFSIELMKRIKTDDGNLIASGFSVDAVLSMLLLGAGGKTKDELNNVLHFNGVDFKKGFQSTIQKLSSDPKVSVIIANAMWVDQKYTVKKEYTDVMTKTFQAEEHSGDFKNHPKEATDDINAWVNDKTNKLIPKLFDKPLDKSTIMVLLNAISFKGKWQSPFLSADTKSEPFYNFGNSQTVAPLMHQKHFFGYKEDKSSETKFLRMDYVGDTMSFIAVLPKQGASLDDFQKGLTCETIKDLLDIEETKEVIVTIPKFDVTSDMDLKPPLTDSGLGSIFESPDLSGIGEGRLQLTKIVQKARIKFYEEGTEAAAVTGGVVGITAVREPTEAEEFLANRPFYYFIVQKSTGLILFSGKLNKL